MYRSSHRNERLQSALAKRQKGLAVILENIHDPHNAAAILRSCDAVGVWRVAMVYSIEEPPKIKHSPAAASALKWLNVERYSSIDTCYDSFHSDGYTVLATKIEPTAKQLYEYDLTKPTAIVLGNEHRGISDEAAKLSDGLLYIPMMGMVESVNVSVAAAITLFEALRQRQQKRMYDAPTLNETEYTTALAHWLKQ